MRCFYHPTVEAVALCKSCQRGLCPDCVAEVGLSSSCRNRCESDVLSLNELLARARAAPKTVSGINRRSAIFLILCGVVFLLLCGYAFTIGFVSQFHYYSLAMGLLFTGWGVAQLISG